MTTPDLRKFYGDDIHIGILSIFDGLQAQTMRTLLESMDTVVHLVSIGTPGGFLRTLEAGEFPDYLVIASHGDENGLCFGDFIDEIDVSSLVKASMPYSHVASKASFGGSLVINIACQGGQESVAENFLHAGARAYIGVNPDPNWRANLLFLHHFFYNTIVQKESSNKNAWHQAASYDKESRSFLYYDAEGCHRA